jgi:hypothetical protein
MRWFGRLLIVLIVIGLAVLVWTQGPQMYRDVAGWTRVKAVQAIVGTRTDPKDFLRSVATDSMEPVEFTIGYNSPITVQIPDERALEASRNYTTADKVPRVIKSWTLRVPRAYVHAVGYFEGRLNEVKMLVWRDDWQASGAVGHEIPQRQARGDRQVWFNIGANYRFPKSMRSRLDYFVGEVDPATCIERYKPELDMTEVVAIDRSKPTFTKCRTAISKRQGLDLLPWDHYQSAHRAGSDTEIIFNVSCVRQNSPDQLKAHRDREVSLRGTVGDGQTLCSLYGGFENWSFTLLVSGSHPEHWRQDYNNAVAFLRKHTVSIDD